MTDRERIFQRLAESKKYRHLCPDTLFRLADWALHRYSPAEAEKAAKNKLHQVYGAFMPGTDLKLIETFLSRSAPVGEGKALEDEIRPILAGHASTRERLPIVASFYADLFSLTGKPQVVIDLACGLNPFTLPWMGLEPDAQYYAFDMDCRLMALIRSFFSYLQKPYQAVCTDLLTAIPPVAADVALLLKALPSLEQQEKGAAERIISGIKARYIVVSFPVRTLSGKARGMEKHYRRVISDLAQRLGFGCACLSYPDEVFYILSGK